MQIPRMLITAATALATAVAWPGGPSASAQEPGAPKPRIEFEADGSKTFRIVIDEKSEVKPKPGATVGGDAKVTTADEPVKPPGGAMTVTREVKVFRAQAPKAQDGAKDQPLGVINRVRAHDDAEVLNQIVRFRTAAFADPHRDVLLKLKAVANESCVQCHAGGASVRLDDMLGLTLVPADETLRSQLKLDGKGLVVTAVAHGSSGESGGVKEKDILIECEGKRLGSIDDLRDALKAIGAGPRPEVVAEMPKTIRMERIALKLVRAGEMKEVAVPPPFPPTVVAGRVAGQDADTFKPPSYWIGVSIDEVDDTLREHLKLGERMGLVVSDVLKDSPAAKVGLEKNDILLRVDGKPLRAPEDLIKAVQAAKGESTLHLRLRQAGVEREIAVRPEKRKEPEPAAAPASGLTYREFKVGEGAPAWVMQVAPFLDAEKGNMVWATPGGEGQFFVWRSPIPETHYLRFNPTVPAVRPPVQADPTKAPEAVNTRVIAEYERLIAEIRAQAADRRALTDSLKKAAAPGESLARIDAQLKALEAQVGEIKRSMDELKAAIKKDSPR